MRKWKQPLPNPIDPPPCHYKEYNGYQKIINSNNGQIDFKKLEEHIEMLKNDPKYNWEELVPIDFKKINLGDRIRYTILNPKDEYLFRTGGWVIAIDEENYNWISYMAHTHTNWSIQKEDCVRMWITKRKKKNKTVKNKVIKFKIPEDEKKYNSYLLDNE
jgi:hypothetical protein